MNDAEMASTLCELAKESDVKGLSRMVQFGANVNVCDYDKRTALHIASCENLLDAVECLLSHGADAHFQDRWGHTALDDAFRYGYSEVVSALVGASDDDDDDEDVGGGAGGGGIVYGGLSFRRECYSTWSRLQTSGTNSNSNSDSDSVSVSVSLSVSGPLARFTSLSTNPMAINGLRKCHRQNFTPIFKSFHSQSQLQSPTTATTATKAIEATTFPMHSVPLSHRLNNNLYQQSVSRLKSSLSFRHSFVRGCIAVLRAIH